MKYPCGITCFISAIILVSMFFMTIFTSNDSFVKNYKKQLSPKIRKIYDKIVKERTQIYFTGYFIGILVSVLAIFFLILIFKKISIVSLVCTAVLITFVVNHLYYIMSPKSDWMIKHIESEEDKIAWLKMYKTMQYNYHLSFALGIIAVGVFAFSFRASCQ